MKLEKYNLTLKLEISSDAPTHHEHTVAQQLHIVILAKSPHLPVGSRVHDRERNLE